MQRKKSTAYLTWGCADDLAARLRKTLYCSEDLGCYDSSSAAALTDMAVSMYLALSTSPRRKLTHRYASSLTRQLAISPCSLMMSIIYTQRLQLRNPDYLDHVSSSDLFVVSMLVANKFLVDEGEHEEIFNDDWAEAAGLAVSTMNRLEREFLAAMDWNVYVNPDEFLEFCTEMETRIALKHGLLRGWFSYTDLTQFLIAHQYQKALKAVLENTVKIISGCALLYGFSLSILASSIICYTTSSPTPKSPHVNPMNQTRAMLAVRDNAVEVFGDRFFSRPRRSFGEPTLPDSTTLGRQEIHHSRVNMHHSTFPVALSEAVSTDVKNASRDTWQRGKDCHCASDPDPCFEVSFAGALRQTRLAWDFNLFISDHLSRQSCVSWMFDRDKVAKKCSCDHVAYREYESARLYSAPESGMQIENVYDLLMRRPLVFGVMVS